MIKNCIYITDTKFNFQSLLLHINEIEFLKQNFLIIIFHLKDELNLDLFQMRNAHNRLILTC